MADLTGQRILVAGATGSVGEPVAKALAATNDVIAVARFTNPKTRARLEAAGVTCVPFNLTNGDYDALPDDVDYVANFAVAQSGSWDADLRANAEALGLLMQRYASASGFLHCSSTAVYRHEGPRPHAEGDALGDNHRDLMETYSITKIATEAVARTMARALHVPTTIARLNVPYGNRVGFPYFHLEVLKAGGAIDVHPERPNVFCPIHTDDIARMVTGLLGAASVPATIVNWGGDQVVSIEEWCTYLGELTGLPVTFNETSATVGSVVPDLTRMHELVGGTTVDWRDGVRAMVAARYPDLLVGP